MSVMHNRLERMEKTVYGRNRCILRRVFVFSPETASPEQLEEHQAAVAQAERDGLLVEVINISYRGQA